jgi:hypothetical protein
MLNLALISTLTLPLYLVATDRNESLENDTLSSIDSTQYTSNAKPTGGVGDRWVAFSSEHWGISVSEHDDLSHIYVFNLDTDDKK